MKTTLKTTALSGIFLFFSIFAQAKETEPDVLMELDEVIITSQHGEQRLLDIPASITTITARTLENANITTMEQLAGFVPGLNILTQTPGRPNLVIRGLTSDEVSPTAQPRVSVYFNQVPISRASMAITELYDMERVEVLKGPQGTLFGRGAQAGAIHFITRRPSNEFGGHLTAGFGNFGAMHFEGAVNAPVIDNVLAIRVAGIYSYHNGWVENTMGGRLSGRNTAGFRGSIAFTPENSNFSADLIVNYQRDHLPGTAFMSRTFPNADGDFDIFNRVASLSSLDGRGEDLHNNREVFGTILNMRYRFNENNYISSITSVFTNSLHSRFDGDGSQFPILDMQELVNSNQFTQEIRYNFSTENRRFSGIAGVNFWQENVDHTHQFAFNEQYLFGLLLPMFLPPGMPIPPGFPTVPNLFPMPAIPGFMIGMPIDLPLPAFHEEKNFTEATNRAFDVFFDGTYRLLPRLSVTAGVRGTFENFSIQNRAWHSDGAPSTLGQLFGMAPNIFFAVRDNPRHSESFSAFTWRASLKYDITDNSNVFAGYSRGHRPSVLQHNEVGDLRIVDAESLHSFDVGYRFINNRLMADVSLFYQLYRNFQSWRWAQGMGMDQFDAGNATNFGAEISGRFLVNDHLVVFGNYAFTHATFHDYDNDGEPQPMAGNVFRLTPRHSFLLGFTAGVNVANNVRLTFTPTFRWQSHIYFEDANEANIAQDAYGLLNANLAVTFKQQRLTLSLFGNNLTNENYLIGAGNTGAMFGIPTFVPGAPRMVGARLTWRFGA
ncbi:MAG: TonB-dependent receptor [Bacteroidales bacterium]|nr:TonB-dependent receptor [Bacteroidales bacterium]